MDKCPECNEWWVTCPCGETFCPMCGLTEIDAEDYYDEEDV